VIRYFSSLFFCRSLGREVILSTWGLCLLIPDHVEAWVTLVFCFDIGGWSRRCPIYELRLLCFEAAGIFFLPQTQSTLPVSGVYCEQVRAQSHTY